MTKITISNNNNNNNNKIETIWLFERDSHTCFHLLMFISKLTSIYKCFYQANK